MVIDQNNIEQKEFNNDEFTLKEILIKLMDWIFFLKSKWKVIFFAGLIGGILGLSIAWFEKPIYKATLTFAMEEDKGGSGGGLSGALGLASSIGIDLGGSGGGAFAASNLAELMKSRLIVEKVLLKPININGGFTCLADYFIKIKNLDKEWAKKDNLKKIHYYPTLNRDKFSFEQDSILQIIYKGLIDKDHLNISQKDKKITILSIEVSSEDAIFSKIFCENIAEETSNFYIETKSKKAKINVDVLQSQVDSVRLALNGAINGVAVEADNVYNLNPAFNIKGAGSKKKQIEVQANTAILTNLVVQLELAKINLRKETPLIQLIDKPIFPLTKEKFGKLRSLILGSLLSFFLSVLYLIFSRALKNILS